MSLLDSFRSLWNAGPSTGFHGGIFRSCVYSLMSPAQLAAYTVAARVLLNLDETITKE